MFFLVFVALGIFMGLLAFVYYARDLPRPESLTERPFIEPTRIYDRTGENILYTIYGEERRDLVELKDIPLHLQQAVIATEDHNFYNHWGIDPRGIIRSFLENFRSGQRVQGGSTISQQLIRSTFLTNERTFSRKIKEIILTIELERRYSKDELLYFYLNQVPFGVNIYGVEAAAQSYFNKTISEITVSESAILASLIKAPSYLSPRGQNVDQLMSRRDYIIGRMFLLGYIDETTKEEALAEVPYFAPSLTYLRAPHFVLNVRDYLISQYGETALQERGLKVYTTIDWDLQQEVEKIVKEQVAINKGKNAHNAAVVVIDPKTGDILAMVGSADYSQEPYPAGCIPGKNCLFEPYHNVATSSRQPGSAFKPFVYATAFQQGYTDETIVNDELTNFGTPQNPYTPRNYDGLFRGPISLRNALAQSLNVPAVKVLKYAGIAESIETARLCGITTLTEKPSFYGLPLVLGGGEVTLLEITNAYGVFANEGNYINHRSIIKITNNQGKIVEQNTRTARRAISTEVANLITSILSDNEARSPVFGSNSLLKIGNPPIAVKTGTTQNFRDAWTIGYNSDLVVGVWVGNNDNTSMINADGSVVAAPIWRNIWLKFFDN